MVDFQFAQRMDGLSGNAIREIFKLIAQPNMISFAGGVPSAKALRPDLVAEYAGALLAEKGPQLLQYGITEGYVPLRESIAAFTEHMGFSLSPEQILPTAGGQQVIDLLCKAVINPGDCILVEQPTFLGALHTMRTYQADIRGVPMDDEGVDVDALRQAIAQHRPKLVYLIPTFQNPTGKTIGLERRRALAQLAAQTQTIFIEDDPYRDLRIAGEPLPAIKSFDEAGYVVYCGSFSKLISPGLRVGYAAGNSEILRKMVIGKQAADVHTPLLNQAIIDAFLRGGKLPGMIEAACALYKKQCDTMLEELSTFRGVAHTVPEGGLFIWVTLPQGMDSLALLPKAASRGVAYIPGVHFYPGADCTNTLRLNFSASSLEDIRRGMGILREVIQG